MAINNLKELAAAIGAAHDTVKSVAGRVYKDTECGASFWVVLGGVGVAGYVEGWDGECPGHILVYPFDIDDFHEALNQCEIESKEIWDEVHKPDAIERLKEAIDS